MHFVVEKTDPHAANPHLTDETVRCSTAAEAGSWFDDLAGVGPDVAQEVAQELSEGETVTHVDPETGVEVVARVRS